MSESLIRKVAGYWLIKMRLQHKCFPANCAKFFKDTYFEELLQVAVNNDSKQYNNNLFRENKPTAPTGIRKDNSYDYLPAFMLMYQQIGPPFSRDLY